MEVSRSLVPAKSSSSTQNTETAQAKMTKYEYLFQQSKIISRWVDDLSLNEKREESAKLRARKAYQDISKFDSSVFRSIPDEENISNHKSRRDQDVKSHSQNNSPIRDLLLHAKRLDISTPYMKNPFHDTHNGSKTHNAISMRKGFNASKTKSNGFGH